jgi:hypothetical protein
VRDRVKYAHHDDLRRIAERLKDAFPSSGLHGVLGPDVALVPTPRSAPLLKGGVWPAQRISDALVHQGFGREVMPLLSRVTPVPKSAYASTGNRPTPLDHLESLELELALGNPTTVTVVDDIITKGATLLAAASLIKAHYPDADVRVFGILRTLGLRPDVDDIVAPVVGTITLTAHGDTDRAP